MKSRITTSKLVLAGALGLLTLSCGVLPAFADPYSAAVLADSPKAYWKLNETTGSTALDSAGSFPGVYTNVILDQPGYTIGADPSHVAVAFGTYAGQSTDSYVGGMPVDFATNSGAAFSVEVWVNGGGGQTSGAGIAGKGTGSAEQFFLDCGGTGSAFRFFIRNAAGTAITTSSTNVADGNWHHLVGVCDEPNSIIRLYVDGLQVSSTAVTGSGIRASSNLNMTIGARQSGTSGSYNFQFNGYISDVAVYPRALSAATVQTHYFTAGVPPRITADPTNSVVTDEHTPVTLTSGAYGSTPLTYQWLLNGAPIPGQTNAIFFTNSIDGSFDGANVMLQASNAFGLAYSGATAFTVYSGAPRFLTDLQPSTVTLYPGFTFTYSVSAVGTAPLVYQWYQNGSPLIGATNSSYLATASAGADTYFVAVSNNFIGGVRSNSATVSLIGTNPPSGSYPTAVLLDHPIAYWRLDEPSNSTTANEFAGAHIGTYNNVQLAAPGYSPLFDSDTAGIFGLLAGSDSDLLENDNSAAGTPLLDFAAPNGSNSQFSVEAWVNGPAGQNSAGSCIVAKGISGADEFVLDASGGGGSFRFYTRKATGGTAIINSSTIPDGNWHHLVAVCDQVNGSTSLYIDGLLNSQITGLGATGLASSTVPISIGAQAQSLGTGNNLQFNGTIDEVSIYNVALTATQVKNHYNAAPLPPYFTVQPATNVTAFLGQVITLSATALGSSPMTNQWFSNNVALSGQTNVALSVNTSHAGTNTYFLKVSNAYGSTNTVSAVVSVPAGSGPPTLLTDTTPSSSTRYTTLPLTFSVVASGSAPLTYQWYTNSVVIPGATNSTYFIASLGFSNAAGYNCVVSNSISTIASTVSTLTVVAVPTNAYPQVVLADHPVAYFRLDEPTNSANGFDYVGGNVGQYTSLLPANFPQLGVPGRAPALDPDTACKFGIGGTGVNNTFLGNTISNIDFSVPNGQNGAFSLEAWINGTAGATQVGGAAIVAKGRGSLEEQFTIDINSGVRFYVRNAAGATLLNAQAAGTDTGALVSGNYQMDGKWHHIVGVCDQVNSNLLIYIDGHLIGPNFVTNNTVPPLVAALDMGIPSTGTNGAIAAGAGIEKPTTTSDNVNTTSIGNRNKSSAHTGTGAYDFPFLGVIDDVAFYNYAMTPNQVLNHFNTGSGVRVPLAITNSAGKQVVTWFGSGILQASPNVNGAWTNVPAATSPYTNSAAGSHYYRLKLN